MKIWMDVDELYPFFILSREPVGHMMKEDVPVGVIDTYIRTQKEFMEARSNLMEALDWKR